MPTYTYRRPDGTTFDVFQKMSDDPLTEDPDTGAPVSRMISGGAGLQFKGSGFYLTDYVKKSGSADAAEPTAGDASKKGASKEGAKTEASKTPAAKAPATPAKTGASSSDG